MNLHGLSQMKKALLVLFAGVFLLTGCNLPGAAREIPATPTTGVVIPLVTVAVEEQDEEAEMEVKETPTEEAAEPTEMPKEVEEAVAEATEEAAPTAEVQSAANPTAIPTNDSMNPDPTVYFLAATTCYTTADTTSAISGIANAGTALGALQRKGNFYQVNHPTHGGWLCWVTGAGISPNAAAFDLGK